MKLSMFEGGQVGVALIKQNGLLLNKNIVYFVTLI